MLDADYLCAEPLLRAHLAEAVPELSAVLSAADLAAAQRTQWPAPCVYIVYLGDTRGGSEAGAGAVQMFAQRWAVVLVVSNVAQPLAGEPARSIAGPLLAKIIRALAGYSLDTGWRGLRRESSPPPRYEPAFAHFTTVWSVALPTGALA